MKVRRFVLVASLLSICCAGTAHAQGRVIRQPKDGMVCILVNQNSGRCLSVKDQSKEPGAKIVQGPTPDKAGPSEHWKLLATGDAFRLKNENSGLVLEIGKANQAKGVQPIQWHDQATAAHQLWTFVAFGDEFNLLVGHSNMALAIGQSKLEEGARAIQWPQFPGGLADQRWQLRSVKDDEPEEDVAVPAPVATPWLSGPTAVIVAIVGGAAVLVVAAGAVSAVFYLRRQRMTARGDAKTAATVSISCTGCGRELKVKADMIGKKVKCAKCNTIVKVK